MGNLSFGQSVAVGRGLLDNCIRGSHCIATVAPFTTTSPQTVTDTTLVVLGESQSSVMYSLQKADLISRPAAGKTISFVLLSNENRPNGGVLERFVGAYIPILDIEFNGATPTNSSPSAPLTTIDIANQYDGWVDFPNNPLNALAVFNALMGMILLHPALRSFEGVRELQGQYQDSTYYLQPAKLLPMLVPVDQMPLVGPTLARALDAPLRVLVETGYDRTINPGEPTPANVFYWPNPIKTFVDLLLAVPTGWDDAISYLSNDPTFRPFHTAPQSTYGVGGPPVYTGAVDPYGPPTPALGLPVATADIPNADAGVEQERLVERSRDAERVAQRTARTFRPGGDQAATQAENLMTRRFDAQQPPRGVAQTQSRDLEKRRHPARVARQDVSGIHP